MPISKRKLLTRMLARSGILRILERGVRRHGLLVWNFHRIGNTCENMFDNGVYSATAEEFRHYVSFLQSTFRLITLDECLRAAENGYPPNDPPAAMITFDDGYRDNYELAMPILKELGAQASFFITTGYLEDPRLSWWDRIAYTVRNTRANRLSLEYPTPISIDLESMPRHRAIAQILLAFKSARELDDARFFEELESRAAVRVDVRTLGRDLFMTWPQIQELLRAGMAIGSHTHDHQLLARLSKAEQHRELSESKRILETKLSKEIFAIAYPIGDRSAFSEVTKDVAKEVGYRLGFSFYGGINWPGYRDCFDVRRCTVEEFGILRAKAALLSTFGKSII